MSQVDAENCQLLNLATVCPNCGGMARPNVMMFGDWHWESGRSAAQRHREDKWLQSIGCNERVVVVELGAGKAIPSVREFSQRTIHEFAGRLVRINPRVFCVPSNLDVGFAGGAAAALSAIDLAVQVGSQVAFENPPEGCIGSDLPGSPSRLMFPVASNGYRKRSSPATVPGFPFGAGFADHRLRCDGFGACTALKPVPLAA